MEAIAVKSAAPLKIQGVMPEGYLAQLVDLTGIKNYSNLAQIVRMEHSTSKHRLAVLLLAEDTNPEAFAAWAAANPKKMPICQAA